MDTITKIRKIKVNTVANRESVVEDILCSVCNSLSYPHPVMCGGCSSLICLQCKKQNNDQCPKCKQKQFFAQLPNLHKSILHQLQIKCTNEENGCPIVCNYLELDDHEKVCQYQFVKCKGCHQQYLQKDLILHEGECQHIEISCGSCNSKFLRKDQHLHNCTNYLQKQIQDQNEIIKSLTRLVQKQGESIKLLETKYEELLKSNPHPKKEEEIKEEILSLQWKNIEGFRLSNDKKIITNLSKKAKICISTQALILGKVHLVQFRVKKGNTDLSLGICSSLSNYQKNIRNIQNAWSIGCYDGNKYCNGISTPYGEFFETNDIISLKLDTINGKLSFAKNGKYFGIAFEDERFQKEEFYPAACIIYAGDMIEIISYSNGS